MASQLSPQTIEIVKATVPALEANGLEIVRTMYARMFRDPAIRDLFNQSHHGETGSQPRALTDAILAYARNIENLGVLGAAVERIAQKHVGLQILPEHYPVVARSLLAAIREVLGDAATDEVLAAWGEAYWFLANILIAREQALYSGLEAADGGWAGWRDFRVAEKTRESSIITSFVLVPVDGGPVIRHKPGQYLTFWLDVPGHHPLKRNYSISSAPGGRAYRISVKREPGGVVSGWLHDEVEVGQVLKVSPPAGEFYLDGTPQRPVVLVSGGVGLTPMLSMLHSASTDAAATQMHFVHGALHGGTHALGTEVRSAAGQRNVQATIFYLEPRADDRAGQDYDEEGLITVDWLKRNTPFADADFYLCGPKPFLAHFVHGLQGEGVAPTRIHYEFFGPADELRAA
jgi:nitric oxide dioxygenase